MNHETFHILTTSLSMASERAHFAQEVAQVEQWWKVIYLFSIIMHLQ